MNAAPVAVELIALTPGNIEEATRSYAAQLANILNTDLELPPEFQSPPGAPAHSAESILSYVEEWCRKKKALFFFIVLQDDKVAGSISLSHLDMDAGSARTGYFLATKFQGKGIGGQAFSRVLDIARQQGLKSISGTVPKSNTASRKIWENHGAVGHGMEDEITLLLDNERP